MPTLQKAIGTFLLSATLTKPVNEEIYIHLYIMATLQNPIGTFLLSATLTKYVSEEQQSW